MADLADREIGKRRRWVFKVNVLVGWARGYFYFSLLYVAGLRQHVFGLSVAHRLLLMMMAHRCVVSSASGASSESYVNHASPDFIYSSSAPFYFRLFPLFFITPPHILIHPDTTSCASDASVFLLQICWCKQGRVYSTIVIKPWIHTGFGWSLTAPRYKDVKKSKLNISNGYFASANRKSDPGFGPIFHVTKRRRGQVKQFHSFSCFWFYGMTGPWQQEVGVPSPRILAKDSSL